MPELAPTISARLDGEDSDEVVLAAVEDKRQPVD
jgi:hypothetical protein